MRRRSGRVALVAIGVALALPLGAQLRGYVQGGDVADIVNQPYDGKFTFARIRFEPAGGEGFGRRRDNKWDHDTPRAEQHLMKILSEVTIMRPFMDGGNILALDDPELFKYPVAYLCEVGFWSPTEVEATALRNYLLKGGFLIIDDFIGPHWYNFENSMRRVLPQGRLVKLDVSHPIFDSFFKIESLEMSDPNFNQQSQFFGIYEDNDPAKRLLMIVNYNNDIGDYWEWSDAGFLPINLSNEAYKLGVNYVMYAMTH